MAGGDTELANLLITMQGNLQRDIQDAKKDIRTDIADLREEHGRRLTALEAAQRGGLSLSRAQRRALWTAIGGLALEGARHAKELAAWIWVAVRSHS